MVLTLQKSRLVFGLFEDVFGVRAPIALLLSQRVSLSRIGLIVLRETYDQFVSKDLHSITDWLGVIAPLLDMVPFGPLGNGGKLLATRSISEMAMSGANRSWPAHHATLGRGGAMQTIRDHLQAGRVALAIASENTAQQRQIARTLLANSAYPVETHEFSVLS